MKIALNGSLVWQPPGELEGWFKLAQAMGCEGVDVGVEGFAAAFPEDPVGGGLALIEKYQVAPSCFGLPLDFRGEEGAYLASLEQFPRWAKLAADLNCPRMATWIMPALPDPEGFRVVAGRRLKRAAQLAGEYGARIGLEWVAPYTSRQVEGSKPFIYTMDQMLDWILEIGEPNMGLLVDSWHWYHAGHTVEDLLALDASQVVTCHINDAPDAPKDTLGDVTDRVFPGEGVIDLAGFLGALKQIGYQDYFSPEVLNPTIKEKYSQEEALSKAIGNTRKLLNSL